MKEEYKKYFAELEENMQAYTKLSEKGLEFLFDQVNCYKLGINTLQKCQNLYVDYFNIYTESAYNYDIEGITTDELINYDYKTSEYAEKYCRVGIKFCELYDKLFLKNRHLGKYESESHKAFINNFRSYLKIATAISARWHIQRFIEFYEFDKGYRSKKLPKRLPLLREAMFFADRMAATKMKIVFSDEIQPKRIIFAVQPNSGKSFVANVYCILSLIHHWKYYKSSGVIRITNTGANAEGFSGQIKSMISDYRIITVFPELKKYFKGEFPNIRCNIFKKEPLEEWLLQDLENGVRASLFAVGREKSINGMRNDVALVIDDLSDGYDQMDKDTDHIKMVQKYDVDMDARKEDESIPEFIIGTMFNENDLSNTLIERAKAKYGEFIQIDNPNFRNSYLTKDKSMVVILVDCFNENMESVAPDLISTEKLIDKMNNMESYQFDLVYRQRRGSREPRTFEYDTLYTYDNNDGSKLNKTSICVVDPTRKNESDYFVLGCFKMNEATGKYRFTNVICKRKSLGKVADPNNKFALSIADFLIENNCVKLFIENNTSNLIGTYLEQILKAKNYNFCQIEERYSTELKKDRIINMAPTIKNNIEFPKKNSFPIKSDMNTAMTILTKWDSTRFGKRGNYDDVPDMVAMFADKFIFSAKKYATVKTGNLPIYI